MTMEAFRDGYQFFAKSAGVVIPVSARYSRWDEWVSDIEGEISRLDENLRSMSQNGKSAEKLAGDIAEFWHAGTFNVNSALNRSSGPRASVPRSNAYASSDVIVGSEFYQLKYNKKPEDSVRELSRTISQDARAGSPSAQALLESGHVSPDQLKYEAMGGMLVATDKLSDVETILERKIATESARRPEQAARYQTVRRRVDDRITDKRGNTSTPLTRDDATKLATEVKQGSLDLYNWNLSTDQLIPVKEIMQESLAAGVEAAALSAALGAAPAVIEAARLMVSEGELDDIGLVRGIGEAAVTSSAREFLTGATAAAITSSARAGYLGIPKRLLQPVMVASAASFATDVILDSIRSATGNLSREELADSIGRDALMMTCGLIGETIGKSIRGVMTIKIPVVGYLLGNFVGMAISGILWSTIQRATVAAHAVRGLPIFELCRRGRVVSTDTLDLKAFDGDLLGQKPYAALSDGRSADADIYGMGIVQLRRGVFDVGVGVNGFTWDDIR